MGITEQERLIYLDYQGSTPMDPRVTDAMEPWWTANPANPHASHILGVEAAAAIEKARGCVASLLGAPPETIVFTSGATESINLGIRGLMTSVPRLITWETEHRCTLEVAGRLKDEADVEVNILPVDSAGMADLDELAQVLQPGPAVVSVAMVNNEIGVTQDLSCIATICRETESVLHVDAAQAAGKIDIDVRALGIDLLSISGHKMYGPKGIGALYVSDELLGSVAPLLYGAGQQGGLRPGTLPTPLCVGLGRACEVARNERKGDEAHVRHLCQLFLYELTRRYDHISLNGDLDQRWPGNVSVTFHGIDADILLSKMPDVVLSTGSACSAGSEGPSHVLMAIGMPYEDALSTVRIGFGRMTTADDIQYAAERLATEARCLSEPIETIGAAQ